ncbi:hypothetical protein LNKW23_32780 [Paralimibaculum aggregatum]|uniref:N-acetyltransferase domain-containing protein n=1 Tax=Paralimibaculum aggregatum TaxID=3036245 RepID=A0ABQ6LLI9_9RHOB|nr:GNAT family N-acetyltransferase [Limibaculum sp. NKW23]GMG84064.1 hypothetical protein LNKW23_32780 [Limibaculum sp. NKW23]
MGVQLGTDPGAVRLRPAESGDLPALAELYVGMAASHGTAMTAAAAEGKLALMLGVPAQQAVLMEAEGRPLGYVLWADLGDHVFIRNYAIAAEQRGAGLGAALWQRLRAEVLPARPIRLEVSADHARDFWQSRGFVAWSTGMRSDHSDGSAG